MIAFYEKNEINPSKKGDPYNQTIFLNLKPNLI